jgi:hypothetical protein
MNPGRRSPAVVDKDPEYERMQEDPIITNFPQPHVQHVVRHRASGAFWACVYEVRMDDSDYTEPTSWHRVHPVPKMSYR